MLHSVRFAARRDRRLGDGLAPAARCRHHGRVDHFDDRPWRLDRHSLFEGHRRGRCLQGRSQRHQNQSGSARRRLRSVDRHARRPQADRARQGRCADGRRRHADHARDRRRLARAESPADRADADRRRARRCRLVDDFRSAAAAHDGGSGGEADDRRAASRRSAISATTTPGAISSTTRSKKTADPAGMQIVANERYARADTSVTAQALHLVAAAPEVVMMGGSGTPGALPFIALADRGYKGQIYGTHALINPDFVRVGGAAVEGVICPAGPVVVAEQLPESAPTRKISMEYLAAYQEGEQRAGARRLRALCVRRLADHARCRQARAGDRRAARHAGIPHRFARRHRQRPRNLSARTRSTISSPAPPPASTSARKCWSSSSAASGR